MQSYEYIAKILRADKDFLARIEARFGEVTGKRGVFDAIAEENRSEIARRLLALGAQSGASAKEIYDALISKIEADDFALFEALDRPLCSRCDDCAHILSVIQNIIPVPRGFFIKKEKAIAFLEAAPPQRVMEYLGYATVREMLEKEDLFEVYSALRFIEGNEWLNSVFFKQYEALTPGDFEEREIVLHALSPKWNRAADAFVKKKWHNISHLKEMGVVFVIPAMLGISGELLRTVSLILHYIHEIPFYSDLFRSLARTPETFSSGLVSLLRGDVLDKRIPESEKSLWLVVQRYLAKDDEFDWRLSVPRLNPEAIHWLRVENDLAAIGEHFRSKNVDLGFWRNLGWVGDFFKDEVGNDILVSFNLVDTVMSLVKRKDLVKYLYHHQEALWNKIFAAYFGADEFERRVREHVFAGYFEV
ncbi:MAG: hypothetical protein HY536_00995 [Candidatus Colwellbacteria bacterium]|nr:hypothetical protein [Candidatus Colwellbacteria bacterium]